MNNLSIILRTCDRVNAFSSYKKRDFGEKNEVIKKCVSSLRKSIDFFKANGGSVSVDVVDDNSSEDTKNFLKDTLPYNFIPLIKGGNGNSFKCCIDHAKTKTGLVFLIEDDYLLKKECITSMVNSYYKIKHDIKREICMYPSDYPDRYVNIDKSYILLGSDRHYRQIKSTTCTFMCDSSVIKEFEKEISVFYDYGLKPNISEANSINLIYRKYMCFSPIPSLGEHYQHTETLCPFFKIEDYE